MRKNFLAGITFCDVLDKAKLICRAAFITLAVFIMTAVWFIMWGEMQGDNLTW